MNTQDLLITALEGGSNYWYQLNLRKDYGIPRKEGECLSEYIFRIVTRHDKKVPVFDLETAEFLGYITAKRMREAGELLKKEFPQHYKDAQSGDWDAETADIWFQLVVLKQYTFA